MGRPQPSRRWRPGKRRCRQFNNDIDAYNSCLDLELETIEKSGTYDEDRLAELRAMQAKKNNAAVDEVQAACRPLQRAAAHLQGSRQAGLTAEAPLLTPAEADAAIAAAVAPVSQELVPLAACAGRVLRAALRAERDAPPFDRVAMDGIAFRFTGGGHRRFRIAGIHAAGSPAPLLASPGDCFEVMTGAIMPRGCDTVVPVEQLRIADGEAELLEGAEPAPWHHVHRQASDARAGDVLLEAGTRLAGPELAVAASAGLAQLPGFARAAHCRDLDRR